MELASAKPNSLERFLPLFLRPLLGSFQSLQQGVLWAQPQSLLLDQSIATEYLKMLIFASARRK